MAPANQTQKRSVHELFAGAFRNKTSICESCLFSSGKKHQNSQKWAKFMNFSFWPFLWFGLPGWLLTDSLVQPPNFGIAPKSRGEGASSLFGGWPGSPENVSCSRATPDLHRCNLGAALEQETFSGLTGLPPKRLLAPSPIDLGSIQKFGGCTRELGSEF